MSLLGSSVPASQTASYLRTLTAVRERCGRVFELAKQGKLQYIDYHPENEQKTAEYCIGIIKRDFGSNYAQIPPHGRWQGFDIGTPRLDPLIAKWRSESISSTEITKRILDLFVASVLLDAGAGKDWGFTEPSSGERYVRTEGLAVATLHMFEAGFFSSDEKQPYRVDAEALSRITVEAVAKHMQVSETNPIVGLEGRTSLLVNLGKACKQKPELFGEDARPGNMLDFLEKESTRKGDTTIVPLAALWHILIEGFNPVWPASRTVFAGVPLGDVWPCPALSSTAVQEGDDLVPFHKLSQWMTYSLVAAIVRLKEGWKFEGLEDMTGLPEYRNGGLLLDLGVLSLRPDKLPVNPATGLPSAAAPHPAIVEWRALTVILLDRIADAIRSTLKVTAEELTLAQVLESATWKGGREIAKELRPQTAGPPLDLESDGTVF